MTSLLAGVAALALFWWLSKQFAAANPGSLAKGIRIGGGGALVLLAGFLALRGRLDMAFLAGGLGFGLLRVNPWTWLKPTRTPGTVSRVRSAMIEAELDHDTGRMSGTVLAGSLAGRGLDDLSEDALLRLLAECAGADPDGVRLLEGYLDRRLPGWREHTQAHGDPRTANRVDPVALTEEEAYEVLGLERGADGAAIRRAHRTLMKKFHPDQGGTTYFAARINAAKDLLLNRHR